MQPVAGLFIVIWVEVVKRSNFTLLALLPGFSDSQSPQTLTSTEWAASVWAVSVTFDGSINPWQFLYIYIILLKTSLLSMYGIICHLKLKA